MILLAITSLLAMLAYALVRLAAMQQPADRPQNRRVYVNGVVIRTAHLARVLDARRALGIGEPVLVKGRTA